MPAVYPPYELQVSRGPADRFGDVVNVKDHGAIGDGVNDDTVAINRALTKASALACELYFPAGTYLTSGHDIGSGVRVRGAGRGCTTLRLLAGSNHRFIAFVNATDSSIEDLALDGNKAGQSATSNALIFYHCTRCQATRVKVTAAYSLGIGIDGSIECAGFDCRAESCGSSGFWMSAAVQPCDRSTYDRCVSYNNGQDNFTIDADYVSVQRCVADTSPVGYSGIYLGPTRVGLKVIGNTCLNNANDGIDVGPSWTANSYYLVIIGNVCIRNQGGGISCTSNGAVIADNVCIDNGTVGGVTDHGIAIDGRNMVISGNRCCKSFLNTQDYGLFIRNLSTVTASNLISGNDFSGNALGAVYDPLNTKQTYKDNQPDLLTATFGTGGFTVNAGTTTVITFNIAGAVFGDLVTITAPYDCQGCVVYGYVQSAGVVAAAIANVQAGNKTFGVGSWVARVTR